MTIHVDSQEPVNARRRVTIADVSHALGLTKSTVSRALNNYPDIADGTRLRVRRMADKLGYRPLSHAQAIRTGKVRSLGLVIQTSDHDAHRPFLAEFLAGVSEAAAAEGYTLTLGSAGSMAETLTVMGTLLDERKADGFILPRSLASDPRVTLLRERGAPFVLFGRSLDPEGCAWFDVAGEDAMKDAVRRLADMGHRRIGYIGGGSQYTYSRLRTDGFVAGMTECGLPVVAELMHEGAVTRDTGEAAANALLQQAAPPTAIVCAVDMAALGVYRAAARLGLEIGRDLSVLSYDGIAEGAQAVPPLSTFSVDHRRAGRRLSDILIRRINGDDLKDLRELAPAQFISRGSAGPPAHESASLAAQIAQHLSSQPENTDPNGRKP